MTKSLNNWIYEDISPNPTVKKLSEHRYRFDDVSVTFIATDTHNHTSIMLQPGWEIVLLPDGHYYLNDTSG